MPRQKTKNPTCLALLKDDSQCRSVAIRAGYCLPHAERVAAEAEASGPPAASDTGEVAPVAEVIEPDVFESFPPVGTSAEPPVPVASLRGELRAGLMTEEIASLIRENIVAGLRAVKDQYVSCQHCGKRSPVQVADLGTRVNAAEKLLDQMDGRLKAENASVDQKMEAALRKVESDLASCTDAELQLIVLASHDGEPLSMKETARKLARSSVHAPKEQAKNEEDEEQTPPAK